jgi:hypothetical protein
MAADMQGRLWNFINVFHREQEPEFTKYADQAFLEGIATEAGLEMERWGKDRGFSRAWVPQIEADGALAKIKGLESTPSFLIGRAGKTARPLLHFGLHEPSVFDEAIRELP